MARRLDWPVPLVISRGGQRKHTRIISPVVSAVRTARAARAVRAINATGIAMSNVGSAISAVHAVGSSSRATRAMCAVRTAVRTATARMRLVWHPLAVKRTCRCRGRRAGRWRHGVGGGRRRRAVR